MLAKALARAGKRVLVIDSDESNYGLHRQLGLELPKDFTAYLVETLSKSRTEIIDAAFFSTELRIKPAKSQA